MFSRPDIPVSTPRRMPSCLGLPHPWTLPRPGRRRLGALRPRRSGDEEGGGSSPSCSRSGWRSRPSVSASRGAVAPSAGGAGRRRRRSSRRRDGIGRRQLSIELPGDAEPLSSDAKGLTTNGLGLARSAGSFTAMWADVPGVRADYGPPWRREGGGLSATIVSQGDAEIGGLPDDQFCLRSEAGRRGMPRDLAGAARGEPAPALPAADAGALVRRDQRRRARVPPDDAAARPRTPGATGCQGDAGAAGLGQASRRRESPAKPTTGLLPAASLSRRSRAPNSRR